jgi:ribosomal protein S27AE
MYGMFWELGRERRIAQGAADAERGAVRRQVTETHLRQVEDRLDKLTLVCLAIWEILKEKGGLTDEELTERVKQIDLRDGVADGKVTRTVAQCPKCKRVMSPRHNRCLYCGAQKLNVTAFDGIL